MLTIRGVTWIGNLGLGEFEQWGGSFTTGDLVLGSAAEGVGTYWLYGGTLNAETERIGFQGRGNFHQLGGTNNISNKLSLGDSWGSSGSYNLSSGNLVANAADIGLGCRGVFTQTRGTFTVSGRMRVGKYGTYYERGGTATFGIVVVDPGGVFDRIGSSLKMGGLINAGTVHLGGKGTPSLIEGNTENLKGGLLHIDRNPAEFQGTTVNHGTVRVTATTATFGGAYTEHGKYVSENVAGFTFPWGGLDLTGQTLCLLPGQLNQMDDDDLRAFALYVLGEISGLEIQGDQIINILGHGATIYYNPALNEYLHGKTYAFLDGGYLRPTPLPATWLLLGSALLAMIGLRRRPRHGAGIFFAKW